MENRILMSHSDYEDSIDLPTISDIEFRIKSRNHREFINEKLTLGMFVPTDEDGNILKEPNNYCAFYSGMSHKDFNYNVSDCIKYQEALDNVIFEYFFYNGTGCAVFQQNPNALVIDMNFHSSKNIEYLTNSKCTLTITKSAITKYQI